MLQNIPAARTIEITQRKHSLTANSFFHRLTYFLKNYPHYRNHLLKNQNITQETFQTSHHLLLKNYSKHTK